MGTEPGLVHGIDQQAQLLKPDAHGCFRNIGKFSGFDNILGKEGYMGKNRFQPDRIPSPADAAFPVHQDQGLIGNSLPVRVFNPGFRHQEAGSHVVGLPLPALPVKGETAEDIFRIGVVSL